MKFLITLILSIICGAAYSAPMSEDISICYQFTNNKLIKKSSCIVSSGYGAGGSYTSIEQGKTLFNRNRNACSIKAFTLDGITKTASADSTIFC